MAGLFICTLLATVVLRSDVLSDSSPRIIERMSWKMNGLLSMRVICLAHCILLLFTGCSSDKKSPSEQPLTRMQSETALLATVPEQLPTTASDKTGKNEAVPVQNLFQVSFSDNGQGVAAIIETGGGVRALLNGKTGKTYKAIGAMVISPDGQHIAYSAAYGLKWRMLTDDVESSIYDTVGPPVYSSDSRHVAYETQIDGRSHLIVDNRRSNPSPKKYTFHDKFFSNDSKSIISIEFPDDSNSMVRLTSRDLAFTKEQVKEIQATDFVVNDNNSRIALNSVAEGKKRVVEYDLVTMSIVNQGTFFDVISNLTYGPDGITLAYVAERGGNRYVVLDGREEPLPYRDKIESITIMADKSGAGLILSSKSGYFVHQAFAGTTMKGSKYMEAASLVYSNDGLTQVFVANKGKNAIVMVVNRKEGPAYDMIVSPMFSPDGRYLVYRARKDGKRFVVVADAAGKVLRQHPDYDMVYQPTFLPDGASIAYGVKDGQKLIWKVEKL